MHPRPAHLAFRLSFLRAEAAVATSERALAEARERAMSLADELRGEREAANEERRLHAQRMHDTRAQQVPIYFHMISIVMIFIKRTSCEESGTLRTKSEGYMRRECTTRARNRY